ncbi:MAG: hypothetical protein SO108_06575 [Bacilli bacterium]|nr:hypothetical protein [Bacilli bacterium]
MYANEIAMYPDIMENLEYYMNFYGYNDFQIFKTWKEFPPTLQSLYQKEWDILGDLGKPDITVLYRKNPNEKYKTLIVEVKLNSIVLKDIAQAKMYGDIFKADKVFLVAPADLRRQIAQYYDVNNAIFTYCNGQVRYVKFDNRNLQIQQSFPIGGDIL